MISLRDLAASGWSVLALLGCSGSPPPPPQGPPLSTVGLQDAPSTAPAAARYLTASDGVRLAYRIYRATKPRATLVFFHGGGAHSGASYHHLAAALSENHHITVMTPDLRGHGASEGRRGDTPDTAQIFHDVVNYLRVARQLEGDTPLYLGGHSSGAGVLLNFSAETEFASAFDISGYLFVAPNLGFRSKTMREPLEAPFASVRVRDFVCHSMTLGLFCGHHYAVRFHYAPELLKNDLGLVSANTVMMANALTPTSPKKQLRQLATPLGIWLAEDDALIDSNKVETFVRQARLHNGAETFVQTLHGQEHLSILLHCATPFAHWISRLDA